MAEESEEPTLAETSSGETTITMKEGTSTSEGEVSAKAKESGRALKDLVVSLGRKAKATAQEKTEELKQAVEDETPLVHDAADIQRLGDLVDYVTSNFEDMISKIGSQPYEEQERLLIGYRRVLEEEINVINARRNLARRLAPSEVRMRNQEVKNIERTSGSTETT